MRDRPEKIDVPAGTRMHLGHARELKPTLDSGSARGASLRQLHASGDYVAAIDAMLASDQPGTLPRQRLRFELAAAEGEVFLQDRGLLTSYGIFGAPGSGKTFLYKYLLRQLLAWRRDDPQRKLGALILDPKAALIDDLRAILRKPDVDREDDLVVVNAEALRSDGKAINIIDCAVNEWALADLLVLAARSAGITASEDYWFLEWSNLFGASLYLLNNFSLKGVSRQGDVVTLRQLLDALLIVDRPAVPDSAQHGADVATQRGIQRLAQAARERIEAPDWEASNGARARSDALLAISQIERFFRADYVHTIMAFVARAYGPFQRSQYDCFSRAGQSKRPGASFYDAILEQGKIVLVSVSPADPLVAKTLCTLVKVLFQQTVMQRLDRCLTGELSNFSRPVLLGCDEYAEVASEVPGQPMGDGRFFSLAREFGCLGILATQSVNVLQATSLKENWKSVFSTFGAKIFMRLADNETAKEASELAGKGTWYVTSRGLSQGKDGVGSSEQRSIQEFPTLPTEVTTQGFMMGDAVAIGSLSGGATSRLLHFFRVPQEGEQEAFITGAKAAGPSSTSTTPASELPTLPVLPVVPRPDITFEED